MGNYVDQSETCMIVLCASIYMEYLHTYANVTIWNQMLYEPSSYENLGDSMEGVEVIVECGESVGKTWKKYGGNLNFKF